VSIVSLLCLILGISGFWIIELEFLRKPRRIRALRLKMHGLGGRSLLAFVILLAVALLLVTRFGH
jgi:hypothetical protein